MREKTYYVVFVENFQQPWIFVTFFSRKK